MKKIVKIERNEKYGNVVSSRIIANELGKMHKTILRDIDNISISTDLSRLIYPSNYKDSRNRTYREYLFTKDGFILYMFNIQGHIDFKMAYINEFNRMEKQLKEKNTLPFNKEENEGVKLMRQIYEAKEKVQVSLSNYKFLLLSNKVMIEDELMYIKNSEFKTNKMEIYFNGKSHCLAKSLIEFE